MPSSATRLHATRGVSMPTMNHSKIDPTNAENTTFQMTVAALWCAYTHSQHTATTER